MKFKENSVVVTRNGSFLLKKIRKTINTSTLQPILIFVVDDKGKEKNISEKDVIKVEDPKIKWFEVIKKKIINICSKNKSL